MNVHFIWLAIPTRFMMLKTYFGGKYRSIHTVKMILDHINEIPTYWTRDIICHAISMHPPSVRHICRQKGYEDMNIKTDIALLSCRCV